MMENDGDDSTTTTTALREPLLRLEKEEEDACCSRAAADDDVESPAAAEPSNNSSNSHNNNEPFVFSIASELTEMANLAWPLAVSFFCRMGMASTDSAFVGHIPGSAERYLAAAVLSDLVVNCLITPPLAFNQVLNALVAQAIGSGNPKMAGIWLQQSLFWLTITMLPCLMGFYHVPAILMWLQFPADISHLAGTYAKYNIWWPIPNGWYQCMRFYFQAQGLPRPAMYNNLLFLLVNAALNYFFVVYLHWGFVGAAISLSTSRTLQPVVYYIYMVTWKQHHTATWPGLSWSFHSRERTLIFLQQALPNVGTLLFQQVASQATTIFVGKLGTTAIAVSSALNTIGTPLAGTLSATSWTVSSVRVGFHLGRGHVAAARHTATLVLIGITITFGGAAMLCYIFRRTVLEIATNEEPLIQEAMKVIPAMLIGTYLSLLVGNITSGVFSGMGRPMLATILSFGFELPLSIVGVAVYIVHFHGNLQGVYWLQAALSFFEVLVVTVILITCVDWHTCAEEVRLRQQETTVTSSHHHDTVVVVPSSSLLLHQDEQVEPLINGNHNNHETAAAAAAVDATITASKSDDPENQPENDGGKER